MSVAADTKARQAERITFRGGLKDFAFALLMMDHSGIAIFVTVLEKGRLY